MCQTFLLFEDCPFRSSGQGHVGHTLRHPHLLLHTLVRTLCWHGRQHEAQIHKGLAVNGLKSSLLMLWHTVRDVYANLNLATIFTNILLIWLIGDPMTPPIT